MKKITQLLALLSIVTLIFTNIFAAENEPQNVPQTSAVNFFVTPLKYELKLDP
jgi:hypothetical protein